MSLQLSDFESLVGAIADVHQRLHQHAVKAVNTVLTLRNWLIGCYVQEYELGGSDRAAYGERLIERLAERLKEREVPRTDVRELRRYRQFFLTYPLIRESLSPELTGSLPRLSSAEDSRRRGDGRSRTSPICARSPPSIAAPVRCCAGTDLGANPVHHRRRELQRSAVFFLGNRLERPGVPGLDRVLRQLCCFEQFVRHSDAFQGQ